MTDDKLIRNIARRDREAFAELVRRYQDRVYSVCVGLLHDHPSAQDAAQEVFLEVYRSAAGFRFECRVSSWLYRIAVSRALNMIRSRRRSRSQQVLSLSDVQMSAADDVWKKSGEPSPEESFERTERRAFIHGAVDSLPPKQRIPLILQRFEGFTSAEIAEILDLPVTAVEARIRRARSNLKKQILAALKKS
jgi:RNA polymerase sigma-70 factor (ECF subfamily)